MPISQQRLGRFAVIPTYRWALAASIFWSFAALVSATLIVSFVVEGKPLGSQRVVWLVVSVALAVQSGISLLWHHRERAAGRYELS